MCIHVFTNDTLVQVRLLARDKMALECVAKSEILQNTPCRSRRVSRLRAHRCGDGWRRRGVRTREGWLDGWTDRQTNRERERERQTDRQIIEINLIELLDYNIAHSSLRM